MNGSTERILVISPNWLGDVIMALPAVQRLRKSRPEASIHVLAKPSVSGIWSFVDGVDEIINLPRGTKATFATGKMLRTKQFSEAFVLPNSFRSALIAWLAKIPKRRGTAFHGRYFLVNDRVRFTREERSMHQAREDFKILCGDTQGDVSDTGFKPSPQPGLLARLGIQSNKQIVGVIPGAARGPSKRWPYFSEAASLVAKSRPNTQFVVFGGKSESALCAETAAAIGSSAVDVSGRTTLAEFAAALAACSCVMCNDSGGMHLASAAGVPVVAVFGRTDPEKTGPIGRGAVLIRAEGVAVSRKIARDDPVAVKALASIAPERVSTPCLEILRQSGSDS